MKKLVRLIGLLPFVGKLAIRPRVFKLYNSATTTERRKFYWKFLVFLVLFVFMHWIQMDMGFRILKGSSPILVRVVGGLYAFANALVVIAQAHLIFRATVFYFKGRYPRSKKGIPEYTETEESIMLGVTLVGQILFFSLYMMYK